MIIFMGHYAQIRLWGDAIWGRRNCLLCQPEAFVILTSNITSDVETCGVIDSPVSSTDLQNVPRLLKNTSNLWASSEETALR